VLRDHSILVLGQVSEPVRALAERTAAERSARLVVAGDSDESSRLAAPGAYQRRNFAVAVAAAREAVGALDPARVQAVGEALELPGRMQVLDGDPPLIVDAAHNPHAAQALAEALPEAVAGAPVVACLAILADKDAAGILEALAPRLELAICTEVPVERLAGAGRPGAESLDAARLGGLAQAAGVPRVEAIADPEDAVRRAAAAASEHGGVALIAGSHYLLGYAAGARLREGDSAA
jgi:dihydrofolate synthase/folylpolyglutamate synthase